MISCHYPMSPRRRFSFESFQGFILISSRFSPLPLTCSVKALNVACKVALLNCIGTIVVSCWIFESFLFSKQDGNAEIMRQAVFL